MTLKDIKRLYVNLSPDTVITDKPYNDCRYIIINENIIDIDSLLIDYKSDLRAYYGLNPSSL